MNYEIGHSADFHIGESKHILGDGYLNRAKDMLWKILAIIIERKLKYFVLAGDVFDKPRPSQEEKDLFVKWVREVDDTGCILIILEGNHDSESAEASALDTIALLQQTKLKNVHVVTKKSKNLVFGDTVFACVPWQFSIEKTATKLYNQLEKKPKRFIVVGHLPLPGITTDTGWFIKGSHKMLSLDFVDVYLLGDIHARFISKDGRLQMPGSPCQHEWGDKPGKGISLLSLKALTKPHFEKVEMPEFVVVKSAADAKKQKGKIVKLVSNEILDELPDNVVDHQQYFTEDEIINYESEFKVTEGLPEFMADKGFNKKDQSRAMRIVSKLIRKTEQG